jgi:hypothetical protein
MGIAEVDERKSNIMYLYIIQGHLMQKVKDPTDEEISLKKTGGAIRRDWEKDGKSGVKWEIQYKNLTGHLTGVEFGEHEFGDYCILKLESNGEKAHLKIVLESKYFSSFGHRFSNINFDLPLTINAYDFENENKKKMTGLSLTQEGKKLKGYFWDDIAKVPINGMVQPGEDKASYVRADWIYYYSKVTRFLKEHIESELSKMITGDRPPAQSLPKSMTERSTPKVEDNADDDLPF